MSERQSHIAKPTVVSSLATWAIKRKITRVILRPLWGVAIYASKLSYNMYFKANLNRLVKFESGDFLLLADSNWASSLASSVIKAKRNCPELKVVSLIYDLIPLTHSNLVESSHSVRFADWFNSISRYSDGIIGISQTAVRTAVEYLEKHDKSIPSTYFHLGADYIRSSDSEFVDIRPAISKVMNSHRPTFLMVGTIEPRKNHLFALKAFEELWSAGFDCQLCVVGRLGWQFEEITDAIKASNEYQQRLFMFNNVGDNELSYCYQKANALLWPSVVEGFGLPIIEALHFGKVVFSSDIPIHREVGGEFCSYFDLSDCYSLVKLIKEFLVKPEPFLCLAQNPKVFLSWKQATYDLLERSVSLIIDPSSLADHNPQAVKLAECRLKNKSDNNL